MKPWRLESDDRVQETRAPSRLTLRTEARPSNDGRSRRTAGAIQSACLVAVVSLSSACFPHEEQRLTCDDVYPPGQFDYRAMESLIVQDQIETSKGCLAAPCHTAETQRGGVRLDTRDLIYEELSTRPELYYETLTTGYMPHDGVPWDEEDLKIFRSWYCAGAFPP